MTAWFIGRTHDSCLPVKRFALHGQHIPDRMDRTRVRRGSVLSRTSPGTQVAQVSTVPLLGTKRILRKAAFILGAKLCNLGLNEHCAVYECIKKQVYLLAHHYMCSDTRAHKHVYTYMHPNVQTCTYARTCTCAVLQERAREERQTETGQGHKRNRLNHIMANRGEKRQ